MQATEASAIPRPEQRRLGVARPRYGELVIRGLLFLCAALSVATTVGIVVALAEPTIEFFGEIPIGDFFTGTEWSPLFADAQFGVLPLITATLTTTFWALVVCIPFGLGSAIYLSEYAHDRTRRTLKPVLEILAGIPTVVYGFFALTFVTPLLQDIWFLGQEPGVFNALSAGLVMGVMILPTVASLSEDAMAAVPQGLRQGAFALGATRLKVSTRVVVPAALSGIVASFALGSTLFVATFLMNILSIRLVRKYREVYE